jgi:hypothetical protein
MIDTAPPNPEQQDVLDRAVAAFNKELEGTTLRLGFAMVFDLRMYKAMSTSDFDGINSWSTFDVAKLAIDMFVAYCVDKEVDPKEGFFAYIAALEERFGIKTAKQ